MGYCPIRFFNQWDIILKYCVFYIGYRLSVLVACIRWYWLFHTKDTHRCTRSMSGDNESSRTHIHNTGYAHSTELGDIHICCVNFIEREYKSASYTATARWIYQKSVLDYSTNVQTLIMDIAFLAIYIADCHSTYLTFLVWHVVTPLIEGTH